MEFQLPTSLEESWRFLQTTWEQGVFGVGYNSVLYAVIALLIALFLRGLFARWVLKMIRSVAAGTETKMDDALVEALAGPLKFVFLIVGVDVAFRIMPLDEGARAAGDQLVRSLIAIAVFWALHRLAGAMRMVMQPIAEMLTPSAVEWLVKSLQIIFLVVGVASVLEIWGVKVAPLLAGLGIFGVAVALGAQDLFKNLIAGFLVMAEKRFRKGDWIKVDGVVEGVVEMINFRSTVVRRFDQGPVYVPNSFFADNAVINFSRMSNRRIFWTIGVEYNTTVEQLRRIRDRIEAYLRANEDFVQPPHGALFVHIDGFADSSIDIMIYCFTKTKDWGEWLAIKEELACALKIIVESEGSGFAFPSRTIYVEHNDPDAKAAQVAAAKNRPPPELSPRRIQSRASAGGE